MRVVRRLALSCLIALGALAAAPAPSARAQAAYDTAQLNPDVRAAVMQARQARARAETLAARAREAEQLADQAADRARRRASGTADYMQSSGQRYLGEVDDSGSRETHGILMGSADWVGDRYAGEWRGNIREGVGVYSYASNRSNTNGSLRYEGQYVDDHCMGLAVYYWTSGDRYYGQNGDCADKEGVGVLVFADGRRYEGEWADDQYNGYGVFWDRRGGVMQQGLWADGRLVTSLAP